MSETLGKQLKERRTKAGYSLEQIAELTRIPVATLIAIEAGDSAPLPAKPFARGFIRTYAKLVGLDPDRAVALFDQESPVTTAPTSPSAAPPNLVVEAPAEEKESILWFQASRTFFMLIGILVTLVLSGIIFVALDKVQSYDDEKSTSEDMIAEDTANDRASQSEEEIFVTPTLPQDPELSKKQSLAKDGKPETATGTAVETVKVDSATKNSGETPALTAKTDKAKASGEKKKPAAKVAKVSHKLSVQALQDVELTIIWSIGPPQVFLLKPNEIKNIVFSSSVTIRMSNGSAVRVTYDGDSVDHSKEQQPIELSYP